MDKVDLQHGGGGTAMQDMLSRLLAKVTLRKVQGGIGLDELDDAGTIPLGDMTLVLTTDSYTVKPLFFNGGNIGKLSVCGTINDLAVMGAKPLALSSAFIVSAGFLFSDLEKIMDSLNAVLEEADVPLITGDTKVIEGEGLTISTTGIGIAKNIVRDSGLKVGDKIIVNGTVGDHGLAILSQREGIEFETKLCSDCAPLWDMVNEVLGYGVHAMKDPTRGGLASALNDMAQKSGVGVLINEEDIPLQDAVRSASEMLGIDPLTVANEGKIIFGVSADDATDVLKTLHGNRYGKDAKIIGEVTAEGTGCVTLETVIGGRRILETPVGDPVPRVC